MGAVSAPTNCFASLSVGGTANDLAIIGKVACTALDSVYVKAACPAKDASEAAGDVVITSYADDANCQASTNAGDTLTLSVPVGGVFKDVKAVATGTAFAAYVAADTTKDMTGQLVNYRIKTDYEVELEASVKAE